MNDEFYQALANPYRREIIRMLRWKNMSAGEITARFSISQPSVSRHLDTLKKAGIVTVERRANQMIYSLNLTVMEELALELNHLLSGRPAEETAPERTRAQEA